MRYSRRKRHTIKAQQRKLKILLGFILIFIILLPLFGFKALVGFSMLLEKRNNTDTQTSETSAIILPPILDPIPEATNSSKLIISGTAQSNAEVYIYRNNEKVQKETADHDGLFSTTITTHTGENVIYAKQASEDGAMSDSSQKRTTLLITSSPVLTITSPGKNDTKSGDDDTVVVEGTTDSDMRVTVNDRVVVVSKDGSFSYPFSLDEGENKLIIVATDRAGNQTKETRIVTYDN